MKLYILIICFLVVGCANKPLKPVVWCKDDHCVYWKGKKIVYSYRW